MDFMEYIAEFLWLLKIEKKVLREINLSVYSFIDVIEDLEFSGPSDADSPVQDRSAVLLNKTHFLLQLLILIQHEGIDLSDLLKAVEVLGGQGELVQSLQLFLRGGSPGLIGFFGGGAIRGLRAPFFLRFEEVVPDLNIFLFGCAVLRLILLICWGFRIAADFLDPLARHLQVSNLLFE